LALYIAVSTLILGVLFVMFTAGMSWDYFVKWIGFAITTMVLFGYVLQDSRDLFQRRLFWLLFTFFFFAHCAMWISVFAHIQHWKFIWFYPILIEMVIFTLFRNKLLRNSHAPRGSHD
jgi:hypothetical protein